MKRILESETYQEWKRKLKDRRVRVLLAARINRLNAGLPGDVKPVGAGISELRIHFGAGYRVYITRSEIAS